VSWVAQSATRPVTLTVDSGCQSGSVGGGEEAAVLAGADDIENGAGDDGEGLGDMVKKRRRTQLGVRSPALSGTAPR